jgi:hypothetical protein
MIIALIIILAVAGLLLLCIPAGYIYYYAFARKIAPPLSGREREACRAITARGKGYPFICKLFVRDGVCACRPCRMLEEELGKGR